ncbi:Pin2/Terf1-Interacting Telomerase Inhibitor 1 [Manis pentadactyla]|nr:Pin2/Terf1-Interacting Telomerase Inhibitor 1 [Manis pentadactyla]
MRWLVESDDSVWADNDFGFGCRMHCWDKEELETRQLEYGQYIQLGTGVDADIQSWALAETVILRLSPLIVLD